MRKFNTYQFMISRFAAALGDQMLLFAVPLLILKETGSVKWSALTFAIEWAPRLLFLPVAGAMADRLNIRWLFPIADGSRALTVLVSSVLIYLYPSSLFLSLSIMMALLSLLQSLVFIGMESTLPRQLPVEELPKAQSLLQSCDQLSKVLGPALAAALVSMSDLRVIVLLGAAFFLASLINSMRLPSVPIESQESIKLKDLVISSYTKPIEVLKSRPILLQLIALTWGFNLIYGSVIVLLPAIITQTLSRNAGEVGIIQTIAALTGIGMMAAAPVIVKKYRLSLLGITAIVFAVLGIMFMASSHWIALVALGASLALGADGMFNIYIRSLRAQIIPKAQFGRVTGVIILLNNSSLPFVGILISQLSHWSHPQALLVIGFASLAFILSILFIGRKILGFKSILPSFNPQPY